MKVYCINCKNFWRCEVNTDKYIEILIKNGFNVLQSDIDMEKVASQCLGYT